MVHLAQPLSGVTYPPLQVMNEAVAGNKSEVCRLSLILASCHICY